MADIQNSAQLFNTTGNQEVDTANNSTSGMPHYDYSKGKWGIDNWFRNFFSFGEWDKKRDADYQQWLNNTAVQRRMWDLKQAGINPVLAGIDSGASTQATSSISSDRYNANPLTTASKFMSNARESITNSATQLLKLLPFLLMLM